MKSFFVYRNRDSADAYILALLEAGYAEAETLGEADFMLYDYERTPERSAMHNFMKRKPGFIYPHTPYSYFLWDGIYQPLPVACNFVVGDGAVQGLKALGYPYRVEACGFSRCEIKPFAPTSGKRLLFAPAHPLGSTRKLPMPKDTVETKRVFRWILAHRKLFDEVVVRYGYDLQANGLAEFASGADITWQPVETGALNSQEALAAIGQADIVISVNTLAYLAVAQGKPTIMFGYKNVIPHNTRRFARHYELYRSHFAYPLCLEDLTPRQVVAAAAQPNAAVEAWKRLNIGQPFDAQKFVKIVQEYVEAK